MKYRLENRTGKIIFIILFTVLLFGMATIAAYGTVTGQTTSHDGLNMRSRADTSSVVLYTLSEDDRFEILGQTRENGYLWYNIKFKGRTGYVVSDYVNVPSGKVPYQYGKVNCNRLNFRKSPSDGSIISVLEKGNKVKIFGETYGTDDSIWYYVRYDGTNGFVHSKYITTDKKHEDSSSGKKYEEEIKKFPSSYRKELEKLHKEHPSWVFVADKTGLDWDYVVDEEKGHGDNRPSLVHESRKDSWKSMDKGDYNFSTREYTSWDGPFVAASEGIIKYFMDPRTNLDSTYIFQFISAIYDPGLHTSKGLQTILNGTFMSGKIPGENLTYNEVLMTAAKQSGVSPYTLAAMILQEQGSDGRGGCISGKVKGYEGYYNYFNIAAYPHSGRDAVENGLVYAKNRKWNKRSKSVIEGAIWYGDSFVNNNQHTLYLKKFNVMNGKDNVAMRQYMTNITGASDEAELMHRAYSASMNESLVFNIPVFEDMPSSMVKAPKSGDNNNFLDAISVNGKKISGFDRYKNSYSLKTEGKNTAEIRVTLNNKNAEVSGTGEKKLQAGKNVFYIKVTATSGEVRTYTVTITASGLQKSGFTETSEGMKYFYSDGTCAKGFVEIEGDKYYFNSKGIMQTGFRTIDGKKYFFHRKTGKMLRGKWSIDGDPYFFNSDGTVASKGWIKTSSGKRKYYCLGDGRLATGLCKIGNDSYYFNDDGTIYYGAKTIDGKKYFFNRNTGAMLKGKWYIDKKPYYYNEDGTAAEKGWIKDKDGNKLYYCLGDGKLATGKMKIDGYIYYFGTNGEIHTGIQEIDGKKYYFSSTGIMQKGRVRVGDDTYYFNDDGTMYYGWKTINDEKYFFHRKTGKMLKGKWSIDGEPYYFSSDGTLAPKGWVKTRDGKKKYYCLGSGKLVTGLCQIENDSYYFNEDGTMHYGEKTIHGKKYFFNRNTGVMLKGKWYIDKKPYYYNEDGTAADKGWIKDKDGNKLYYSLGDGKLATGKKKIERYTYYFGTNGEIHTGFQEINGKKYYFSSTGIMQTGKTTIGKDTYYFNDDGTMYYGWKTISGNKYFFHRKTGIMLKGKWSIDGEPYFFCKNGRVAGKGWIRSSEGEKLYYCLGSGKLATGKVKIDGKYYQFSSKGELL